MIAIAAVALPCTAAGRYARSMHTGGMPLRHFFLALGVVAVWGTNFAVIKVALDDLPPLLFATLRFSLAVVPAVFFLPRPKVPVRELAAYGVLIGVGQFGVLYIAMQSNITPGLASLVLQMQVFFTIGLAIFFARERVLPVQWFALALAASGLGLIALNAGGATTFLGLGLALFAAFSWATANIVSKRATNINMLAYVVWASVFAVPPLLVLSLVFEGPTEMRAGFGDSDLRTWLAVLYQSFGNTLFGYGAWSWLLSRHPAATITPMALLVPIFGFTASAWWLGEPLQSWKLAAGALILSGLALNFLLPRLSRGAAAPPVAIPVAD